MMNQVCHPLRNPFLGLEKGLHPFSTLRLNFRNSDDFLDEVGDVFLSEQNEEMGITMENDPYITEKDIENDDLEDFMVKPTDDVLLSAVMEEDGWSHLDVCILPEGGESTIYVHHDYNLSAFPLCVAWVPPNVAAVGTFNPNIELWDLNVVDSQEPDGKLQGHTDAVLGLAAHPLHAQMLASASADTTVRLWDISTQQTVLTMSHHKTKVQSLGWSTANTNSDFEGLLATGGFDQRACIVDVRAHENVTEIPLEADVEQLKWLEMEDGHAPLLLVSTESGDVVCYDLVAGKRRWTLSAHIGVPCSSISLFRPATGGPALLATSAPDTNSPLKLWALQEGKGPALIYQKTSGFGRIHSVAFAPERPFHLAVGGHFKTPQVVNILELAEIQRLYAGIVELPAVQQQLRPLTAAEFDGDSDDETPKFKKPSRASSSMDADDDDMRSAPRKPTKASLGKASAKLLPKKKSLGASRKKKH